MKVAGSAVKPSTSASGENGSATPTPTHTSVDMASGTLGRLRRKGTRRVRMAKMTRLWVASDSTNQPERNRVGPALKPHPASTCSPTTHEVAAAATRSTSSGLRSWRTSTVSGRAPWLTSAFGPVASSRRRASSTRPRAQPGEHRLGRERRRAGEVQPPAGRGSGGDARRRMQDGHRPSLRPRELGDRAGEEEHGQRDEVQTAMNDSICCMRLASSSPSAVSAAAVTTM